MNEQTEKMIKKNKGILRQLRIIYERMDDIDKKLKEIEKVEDRILKKRKLIR